MTKMTRFILLFVIISMLCTMTGCNWGEAENEAAAVPMDSVSQNVSEPGVFGYASNLKKAYKYARKEGDIGTIAVTLSSDEGDYFYTSPWWVDGYREHLTADVLVIAGNVGDTYQGSAVCHKCECCVVIEGTIEPKGEMVTTIECDCDYNNSDLGMKKVLTLIIIVLEE